MKTPMAVKKKQRTCRCEAYPFPHRFRSGACADFDEKDSTAEDQRLDDPRHGQAADINAGRG